jgi:hypothetical protein
MSAVVVRVGVERGNGRVVERYVWATAEPKLVMVKGRRKDGKVWRK